MTGYFHVLTAIDIFVLSFMCILTKLSESLNKKQKRGFFLAFTLIAGISVLEVVTLAVNDMPSGLRWLNIVSNYLGFGLSPAVSLCLVYVLDKKTALRRGFKAAVCCEIAYLIFLALSIPYGLIFSVTMSMRAANIFIFMSLSTLRQFCISRHQRSLPAVSFRTGAGRSSIHSCSF